MKTLEYFEVQSPDGGGMYTETVAKFLNKDDAEAVAVMLTEKSKWPHSVASKSFSISIFESVQEWTDTHDRVKIREAALKKLTPKEIEILGL